MSKEIELTVVGWVAGDPTRQIVAEGVSYAKFRIGSTPRFRDRETGEYKDGGTTWFNVKAWGQLGENVLHSVRRGQPVLVRGQLRTETWQSEEGERSSTHLHAHAVGHDMNLGTTAFVRTVRESRPDEAAATDSSGLSDPWTTQDGADASGLTGPDGDRYEATELAGDAAETSPEHAGRAVA